MIHGSDQFSCANCWYNGLQSGSLGLTTGYCVEHEIVLRRSDETTCARHVRKDLMLDSALQQQAVHRGHYTRDDGAQLIDTGEPVDDGVWIDHDTALIRKDPIGDIVADYGELHTKIASLAMLRNQRSLRADLALFSLARGYTKRCVSREGSWTSGLHLLHWARRRLEEDPQPEVAPQDIRRNTAAPLRRQLEIAQWSVIMARLLFVSDVGRHAASEGDDDVGSLAGIVETAAADCETLSARKLSSWVRRKGLRLIDAALPLERYKELARRLHREAPGA